MSAAEIAVESTSRPEATILPVSLIVPTRDRPDAVRRALEAVLAARSLPVEVIVADQSRPPITGLPEHPDVRIVHLLVGSAGLSRNRNAAIGVASEACLVFIDDDIEPHHDWLDELWAAYSRLGPGGRGGGGAVSGQVVAVGDGAVPSLSTWTEPQEFRGRRLYQDPLYTGNCAISRSIIDELGPFDARLGAGTFYGSAEDGDMGYRILAAGYPIATAPAAVAGHRGARSGWARVRLEWNYGLGQGAFYAKHLRSSRGFTGRRLSRNLRYRGGRIAANLLHQPQDAALAAVNAAGTLVGFVSWPVGSRLIRDRTP